MGRQLMAEGLTVKCLYRSREVRAAGVAGLVLRGDLEQ